MLTCRSEVQKISSQIIDFIHTYQFTSQIEFNIRAENHQFMSSILSDNFDINEIDGSDIASAFDDRLQALPLILNLSSQEVQQILSLENDANIEILLKAYLAKIEICYGKKYYLDFIQFLMCITEAFEGLTLNELSIMIGNHDTTLREICFLKDASPLLKELRSYHGNIYFSSWQYKDYLRSIYKTEFIFLLEEWREQIKQVNYKKDIYITESYEEVLLYFCANLSELQDIYKIHKKTENGSNFDDTYKLVLSINNICLTTSSSDQIHKAKRRLRGLGTVEITIEHLIDKGVREEKYIVLLLESASNAIHDAVILRELALATDIIERLNDFIDVYANLFNKNNCRITFCLARFYTNYMTKYCEEYDTEKAELYYVKAISTLDRVIPSQDFEKCFLDIRKALLQNYIGVFRNLKPQEMLCKTAKLFEFIQENPDSFDKASTLLMIAMNYKSAGMFDKSRQILLYCCDMTEKILQDRNISYMDLTNTYELEIYMSIYWRIVQSTNEMVKQNIDNVSFTELKISIAILDDFISSIITASNLGYGYFDSLRPDMMTTAALLRNSIAYKLEKSALCNMKSRVINRIEDYKLEAFQIVHIITTLYEKLNKADFAYNKIDGMYNQMNCACVYAGFGDLESAINLLEKIIHYYKPQNQQENIVYQTLCKKLNEFKT